MQPLVAEHNPINGAAETFCCAALLGLAYAATLCCIAPMPKIDPTAIAQAAGVTSAYARMLLAGTRQPSLAVALKIYDATGVQLGQLKGLDRRSIDVARQMAA